MSWRASVAKVVGNGLRLRKVLCSLALLALAAPAFALQLSEVRLEKAAFDPKGKEKALIKFHVDAPADLELKLFDGRELLVRTVHAKAVSAGDQSLAWDGKDEAGRIVPPEAYHFTLTANSADGAAARSDLSDSTGGEQLAAENVAWDAKTGRIRYRLKKTSRVNIRVGLQDNGPLLRTLVDWVARPAGDNEQAWDGWDESRVLELADHPKLSVFVDAFALSDNTIMVLPLADEVRLIDKLPWGKVPREAQATKGKLMHYHSQQPIEARSDVEVVVSLPAISEPNAEGVYDVSGRVTFRLDVADKDRERVIRQRFEPVFFVDGTFAFESEVGYLPFSWIWDTATANEGIHYISVNVRGYEGNFGMATLKVNVHHAASEGDKP